MPGYGFYTTTATTGNWSDWNANSKGWYSEQISKPEMSKPEIPSSAKMKRRADVMNTEFYFVIPYQRLLLKRKPDGLYENANSTVIQITFPMSGNFTLGKNVFVKKEDAINYLNISINEEMKVLAKKFKDIADIAEKINHDSDTFIRHFEDGIEVFNTNDKEDNNATNTKNT